MTRAELIEKGEKQLNYIWDKAEEAYPSNNTEWARKGLNQLDMFNYLLDEEYENYDLWFNRFMELL